MLSIKCMITMLSKRHTISRQQPGDKVRWHLTIISALSSNLIIGWTNFMSASGTLHQGASLKKLLRIVKTLTSNIGAGASPYDWDSMCRRHVKIYSMIYSMIILCFEVKLKGLRWGFSLSFFPLWEWKYYSDLSLS
jgi:hypothetical protein